MLLIFWNNSLQSINLKSYSKTDKVLDFNLKRSHNGTLSFLPLYMFLPLYSYNLCLFIERVCGIENAKCKTV